MSSSKLRWVGYVLAVVAGLIAWTFLLSASPTLGGAAAIALGLGAAQLIQRERVWQGVALVGLALAALAVEVVCATAIGITRVQYQPEVLGESVPPEPLPCPEIREPAGLPVQHAFGGRL